MLYGGAIGFLPAAERLRFYEERLAILKEWDAAGYGDPQKVKFAMKMTESRLEIIRALILKGQKCA